MVPEKYRLESIGRFLIAAFDRRRPGVTQWTPELERSLLEEAESELARMETQCRELGVNDPGYWNKVRSVLQSVLLPRYAALAKEEIKLAQAGYHLWRNGDLVARITFAGAGLLLGAAAVVIPWIPITEKWVPWALFVAGPLIPDAQLWFYKKRYQRRINALLEDLAEAGNSLEAYRSIAELTAALGDSQNEKLAEVAAAPPEKIEAPSEEPGSVPARLKH